MMRKLINTSLRLRVLVTVVAAGILVAGVTQLRDARVDLHPEFTPTIVEVQTEALGLSAQEVEQLITSPMEADLLNGVAWLAGHPFGVRPGPVVHRHDLRAGHAALPGPPGGPGAHGPGLRPARRVEAAADAAAGVVHQPDHDDRPLVQDAVARSTSRSSPAGRSSPGSWACRASPTCRPSATGSASSRFRSIPKNLNDKGVALSDVVEATGNALWVSPLSFLEASTPGTGGFIETNAQRLGIQHVSPIESAGDLAQVALPPKDGAGAAGARPLRLGDVATVVEDHQPLIGDATLDSGHRDRHGRREAPRCQHRRGDQGRRGSAEPSRPGLKGLELRHVALPAGRLRRRTPRATSGLAMLAGLRAPRRPAGPGLLPLAGRAGQRRRRSWCRWSPPLSSSTCGATRSTRWCWPAWRSPSAQWWTTPSAEPSASSGASCGKPGGDTPVASTIVDATLEVRGSLLYALVFVLLPVVPVFFMGGHLRRLRPAAGHLLRHGAGRLDGDRPHAHPGAQPAAPQPDGAAPGRPGPAPRLQPPVRGAARPAARTPKPALVTVGGRWPSSGSSPCRPCAGPRFPS